MPESTQHKLDRVRPPRVQITYDVEIGDAIEMKELPFVVGIMADLSGQREKELPVLKERKYVEIDRDNFDDIMKAIGPRLSFKVDAMTFEPYADEKEKDEKRRNKWRAAPAQTDDGKPKQIDVELSFKSLDDFSPISIIKQVPELRELFEARNRLSDLLTKLDGNDKLDVSLDKLIKATEDKVTEVRAGLDAKADGAAAPEGGKS